MGQILNDHTKWKKYSMTAQYGINTQCPHKIGLHKIGENIECSHKMGQIHNDCAKCDKYSMVTHQIE